MRASRRGRCRRPNPPMASGRGPWPPWHSRRCHPICRSDGRWARSWDGRLPGSRRMRPCPGQPVRTTMALLGGQWDPVKVDSGRHAGTVAAEDEFGHSDAVPRKVDPEDVRVIGVVGMKPKAFEQRGYGTEGPNRELAALDEDLDAGTDHGP